MLVKRGDIYYVDLGAVCGSEQGGVRPAVVTQNDIGNKYSTTTIIIPITSQIKQVMPTHTYINAGNYGFIKDSIVMAEQVRVIDKRRIKGKVGTLPPEIMNKIDYSMDISLGRIVAHEKH